MTSQGTADDAESFARRLDGGRDSQVRIESALALKNAGIELPISITATSPQPPGSTSFFTYSISLFKAAVENARVI